MTIQCPRCGASDDEVAFGLDLFGQCTCPDCEGWFEVDLEELEDGDDWFE